MFKILVSGLSCDTELDIKICSSVEMHEDVGHIQPDSKNCGFDNLAHYGLRPPSALQRVSGTPTFGLPVNCPPHAHAQSI